MALMLLALEFLIMSAILEWVEAKKLRSDIYASGDLIDSAISKKKIDIEKCFFILMNGLAQGPADHLGNYPPKVSKDQFIRLWESRSRAALSIDTRIIRDKVKKDATSKFLALSQALFVFVQCLMRLLHGCSRASCHDSGDFFFFFF